MRARDRRIWIAAMLAAAFCALQAASLSAAQAGEAQAGRVHNIVIMISDGCGYKHIEATDLYCHGKTGTQVYEQFPQQFGMKTDSMREQDGAYVPLGYDPDEVWSRFGQVKDGYTDSAAAATALSAGVKTYNGAIGVDVARQPVENILERCEKLGMATGVVTSVPLSHATPAGFVAHSESRNNYEQIARQMILDSSVDCIMGCGNPWYSSDGALREEAGTFRYVGGEPLWQSLVEGVAGAWDPNVHDVNANGVADPGEWVDADHNGRPDDAWVLVQSRADFLKLAKGRTPKRVIGVPQVGGYLQYGRSGAETQTLPHEVPLLETVPTLAEMTKAMLNVLDDDPDGLFAMVEGGAIDSASHKNDSVRMIEEEIDFNNAVQAVVDWVEANSSWDETLLIVTGDHECGYLTRGKGVWSYEPLENRGAGNMPGMAWNYGSHTNSLIPLYAQGKGSELLNEFVVGTDPHRGPYVDNTAVPKLAFQLLGQ